MEEENKNLKIKKALGLAVQIEKCSKINQLTFNGKTKTLKEHFYKKLGKSEQTQYRHVSVKISTNFIHKC